MIITRIMSVSRIFVVRKGIPISILVKKFHQKMEPNKAYVWSKDDIYELHLRFRNVEANVDRPFVFYRDTSEQLRNLLQRVSIKISSAMRQKKSKKRSKKDQKSDYQNGDSSTLADIDVKFFENDVLVVDSKTCGEVFFDRPTTYDSAMYFKIADDVYQVLVNLPVAWKISMPKYMMVGFAVYPRKLETSFVNMKHSECRWYRISKNESEGTPVGNDYVYIPQSDDIGCRLKFSFTPKNNDIVGPCNELTTHKSVEGGPGLCPFETRQLFTSRALSGKSFRIVTYNILAGIYTDTQVGKTMFENCPPYAISVDYRKLLMIKELRGYNADLICLQEVGESLFKRDLSLMLSYDDLEGIFLKKGGLVNEGIALFFKKSRFRVLDNKGYTLGTDLRNMDCLKSIWDVVAQHDSVITRFTDLGTVFQVVTLEHIETGNICLLANTHLYFHPNAHHIRLLQAGMAIYIINDMIQKLKQQNTDRTVSLVFGGDFNSTPDSGIYQLFTSNQVPANYIDWSKKADEAVVGLSLKQPLQMGSACGTPEFTHCTSVFRACLDYIFYDKENLEVEQVIPLPDLDEILSYNGLPNAVFPSDHISLVADLRWK